VVEANPDHMEACWLVEWLSQAENNFLQRFISTKIRPKMRIFVLIKYFMEIALI